MGLYQRTKEVLASTNYYYLIINWNTGCIWRDKRSCAIYLYVILKFFKSLLKLSLVLLIFYNHWVYDIFYFDENETFLNQINLLFSSPRVITLIINSIVIYLLFYFENNFKNKKFDSLILILLIFQYFASVPLAISNLNGFRVALIIFILFYFTKVFVDKIIFSNSPNFFKSISLFFFATIVLFFVGEIIVMNLKIRTFNGQAYVTRNWDKEYIHYNTYGTRGDELIINDKKKKIIICGDSFAEGRGIEEIEDRFGNIIQEKLKDRYNVINLGYSGYHTVQEYESLKRLNVKPEIVILAYYGNDIEYLGLEYQSSKGSSSKINLFKLAQTHCHLLNFIGLFFDLFSFNDEYLVKLTRAYNNKIKFTQHTEDLHKFINYCDENKARLIVIIIPFIQDLESSNFYVNKVRDYFLRNQVEVINVKNLIQKEDKNEMMVNKFDAHLSEKGNKILAEEIIKQIQL